MADLKALTPLAGLRPVTHGAVTLAEARPGQITELLPWPGAAKALPDALMAAHGVGLPAPGAVTRGDGVRCLWGGRDRALLIGPAPDASLASHAAVVDQSDGWAVLRLDGDGAAEVLARLVPIDLRAGAFPEDAVARTLCGHVNVLVTRFEGGIEIMGFRSMAGTLAHEIAEAAASVDARRQGD